MCYQTEILNYSYTDRRPDFQVNMTFNFELGSIRSETLLTKQVNIPVAIMQVIQRDDGKSPQTIYNATTRLCDVKKFFEKVPMFLQAFKAATRQGNYTFSCPMKPGLYIMDNLRFPNRSPFLGFMYRPKTIFAFSGGLFDQLENKTMLPLTTYKFSMKIIKKPCKGQ